MTMGKGMGGGGRGMGRGGGMNRGMGRGIIGGGAIGPASPPPVMDTQSDIEKLKPQAQAIEEELLAINSQISQANKERAPSKLVAVVDVRNCTACGICRSVCPAGAINMNQVAEIDASKCNGCSRCVAQCPRGAISLRKIG